MGSPVLADSPASEFNSHPSIQATVKRKQKPKNSRTLCQLLSSPKCREVIFPDLRPLDLLLPGALLHMFLLLQACFYRGLAAVSGCVINSCSASWRQGMTEIVVRRNRGIGESIQVSQVSPGRNQTNLATLQLASLLRQFMSRHTKR